MIGIRIGLGNAVATLFGEMICMAMNVERAEALEGK